MFNIFSSFFMLNLMSNHSEIMMFSTISLVNSWDLHLDPYFRTRLKEVEYFKVNRYRDMRGMLH